MEEVKQETRVVVGAGGRHYHHHDEHVLVEEEWAIGTSPGRTGPLTTRPGRTIATASNFTRTTITSRYDVPPPQTKKWTDTWKFMMRIGCLLAMSIILIMGKIQPEFNLSTTTTTTSTWTWSSFPSLLLLLRQLPTPYLRRHPAFSSTSRTALTATTPSTLWTCSSSLLLLWAGGVVAGGAGRAVDVVHRATGSIARPTRLHHHADDIAAAAGWKDYYSLTSSESTAAPTTSPTSPLHKKKKKQQGRQRRKKNQAEAPRPTTTRSTSTAQLTLRRIQREWQEVVEAGLAFDWSQGRPYPRPRPRRRRRRGEPEENDQADHQTCTSDSSSSDKIIQQQQQEVWLGPLHPQQWWIWHFTMTGLTGSIYSRGVYHGVIILPRSYPAQPPRIQLWTPSGRFQTYTDVCLSASSFHPETWVPHLGRVRTLVEALRWHMCTTAAHEVGSLVSTVEERLQLAESSRQWTARIPLRSTTSPGRLIRIDHAHMIAQGWIPTEEESGSSSSSSSSSPLSQVVAPRAAADLASQTLVQDDDAPIQDTSPRRLPSIGPDLTVPVPASTCRAKKKRSKDARRRPPSLQLLDKDGGTPSRKTRSPPGRSSQDELWRSLAGARSNRQQGATLVARSSRSELLPTLIRFLGPWRLALVGFGLLFLWLNFLPTSP